MANALCALLISIEINRDVTSGAELLWEFSDNELHLRQIHVAMQNKIICILWSIDKVEMGEVTSQGSSN